MVANPIKTIPRSYQSWSALNATPATDFELDAGNYGLTVADNAGFTNYQLQRLLPDGSTYTAASPVYAAGGYQVMKLPAGRYSMVVVGATNFTGVIEKIDTGRARH